MTPQVSRTAPHRRVFGAIGNGVLNLAFGLAVIFLGWCAFSALSVSRVHYPATTGQRAYASRYCVSEMAGDLGSAYVSKPDPFGSTGPAPRLVIRCTFGPKAYLMKIVDLSRSNETPVDGS